MSAALEQEAEEQDIRIIVLTPELLASVSKAPEKRMRGKAAGGHMQASVVVRGTGDDDDFDQERTGAALREIVQHGGVGMVVDFPREAALAAEPVHEDNELDRWCRDFHVNRGEVKPRAILATNSPVIAQSQEDWVRLEEELANETPFVRNEARAPSWARACVAAIRDRLREGGRLIRVPPIATHWDVVSRWRLLLVHAWDRQEHINILEAQMVVTLGRHLARSHEGRDRRTLLFTDSLVCLGMFGKGRSSVAALLRLARKMMVLRFFAGVRTILRHVETLRNMSDGPTRGQAIGEHPQWRRLLAS